MTGSGTLLDPYIISDVDDLQAIEDNLGSYYELSGNIDASATSGWNTSAKTLTLRPTGVGTETSISSQSPDTGEHWDKVSEVSADDAATRIYGIDTEWERDLYQVANHTTELGIITNVQVYIRCQGESPYSRTMIKGAIKTHDTVYEGSEQNPPSGGNWGLKSQAWATNPFTGVAWTWDEIDAVQIGCTLRDCKTGWPSYESRVTQIYLAVTYTHNAGFDPIILFTGQLDGKGYTISNLFIDRPDEFYCGLIGYTNASIVLKNISMTGVDITCRGTSGALLGYDNGDGTPDIDNCNTSGSITGSTGQIGGLIGLIRGGTVDDCWSACVVVNGSGGSQTGGLIGYNIDAVITSCYATGAVTSSAMKTGGLIGEDWTGNLSKCYATGNVSGVSEVGGLIGRVNENPTISDCYARGNAANPTDWYAGGLIGRNDSGIIDNCYSTGAATSLAYAGGFCGENYGTITDCFWDTETSGNATSDGGTGKTTAQMKTKATFADAGWDI